MKLLKDNEQRQLEKAQHEAREAQHRIQEIERLRVARQAKVDKIQSDYKKKVEDYNLRCQMYAVNQPAWERFCALVNNAMRSPDHYNSLREMISHFNLKPIEKWINELCEPGEKPPEPPVIPEEIDD